MAKIRPFCAIHPADGLWQRIAALPYDVYSRKEAREEAAKDPLSFLNIDRPETQFPEDCDMYAPKVYDKARELLEERIREGSFVRDETASFYANAQMMLSYNLHSKMPLQYFDVWVMLYGFH